MPHVVPLLRGADRSARHPYQWLEGQQGRSMCGICKDSLPPATNARVSDSYDVIIIGTGAVGNLGFATARAFQSGFISTAWTRFRRLTPAASPRARACGCSALTRGTFVPSSVP